MSILLIILYVLVGIVVLFLLVAALVRKEYFIERTVSIQRAKAEVFDYLRHIKNQNYFSKWVMADPNSKREYVGNDGTEGFIYRWDSQNKSVGKGEQEIKKIVEGEVMESEIRFETPFEGIGVAQMKTRTQADGQTEVTWNMRGRSKYPMNIINLFIDGMLGKDMQESLQNLKNLLEKK